MWVVDSALGWGIEALAVEMVRGWVAQGVWVAAVGWGIWWPGWVLGGVVLWSGCFGAEEEGV